MPGVLLRNPDCPDDKSVTAAVDALRKGGVIIYPTETVYGLGADCVNSAAVERIFTMKKRKRSKPIPLIAADWAMIQRYVDRVSETALSLANKFWPGPLTLIFKARPDVLPLLTGGTGSIGFRVSGSAFCRRLAQTLGNPVTATSANVSGGQECTALSQVLPEVRARAELIIDGGKTKGEMPSTVISVLSKTPVLLRKGAVACREIESLLKMKLNTL